MKLLVQAGDSHLEKLYKWRQWEWDHNLGPLPQSIYPFMYYCYNWSSPKGVIPILRAESNGIWWMWQAASKMAHSDPNFWYSHSGVWAESSDLPLVKNTAKLGFKDDDLSLACTLSTAFVASSIWCCKLLCCEQPAARQGTEISQGMEVGPKQQPLRNSVLLETTWVSLEAEPPPTLEMCIPLADPYITTRGVLCPGRLSYIAPRLWSPRNFEIISICWCNYIFGYHVTHNR